MATKSALELELRSLTSQQKVLDSLLVSLKHSESIAQADNKAQFTAQITALNAQKKDVLEQTKTIQQKLDSIENLCNNSNTNAPIPKFGSVNSFKPEEVLILCSNFSGLASENWDTFLKKLINFIENRKLSESATKDLLSGLLKGEAFESFHSMRNESFQEIMNVLESRFGKTHSIYYYLSQLRALTRQNNEPLQSFLARASYLLDKTSSLYPQDQISHRKNHQLMDLLFKFASPSAAKRLREEQLRLHRQGIIPEYKSLVDLACFVEADAYNLDVSNIEFTATPAIAAVNSRREARRPSPFKRTVSEYRNRSVSPVHPAQTLNLSEQPSFDPPKAPSPPPSPKPGVDYNHRSHDFQNDYPVNHYPAQHQKHSSNYKRNNGNNDHFRPQFRRYDDNHGNSRYPKYRYNYLATSQLSHLIDKLTEIFNILNNPKRE